MNTSKSLQTITNSAEYLRYLKAARSENISTVALKDISTATHIEISSVAEDLRQIAGTDVATFATSSLIALIEHYLGYEDTCSAPDYISRDLQECAGIVSKLDEKMLSLNEAILEAKAEQR